MTKRVEDKLMLAGVQIIFKNFAGEKSQFNKAGDRNFSVLIEDEALAMALQDQGWNIRELRSRDDEPPNHHLPVKVEFEGGFPPRVVAIKSAGRLSLDSGTIAMLDYMPVLEADVVINPYNWDVNGVQGVKAYLRTMYAVIDEDEFDVKYSALPEINVRPAE
jgi:hypothetical protein